MDLETKREDLHRMAAATRVGIRSGCLRIEAPKLLTVFLRGKCSARYYTGNEAHVISLYRDETAANGWWNKKTADGLHILQIDNAHFTGRSPSELTELRMRMTYPNLMVFWPDHVEIHVARELEKRFSNPALGVYQIPNSFVARRDLFLVEGDAAGEVRTFLPA